MRSLIYFSGVLGLGLLLVRFVGIFFDLTYDDLFFKLGLGILLAVTLPLYLIDSFHYRNKVKRILKGGYDFKPEVKTEEKVKKEKTGKAINYPSFRTKKQGLKWGGGSVHGAGAQRGSKKGFLQKD